MSESWYCSIFGAELGPMSWDDLAQTLARGELRPSDRVRRGTDCPWESASDVEGLLAAAAARRSVMIPPAAENQGVGLDTLDADHDTDFDIDGAVSAAPANGATDFEITAPTAAPPPSDDDFELSAPPHSAVDDDTDFELAAPAATAPSSEADFELSVPPQAAMDEDTDFEVAAPAAAAPSNEANFELSVPPHSAVDDDTDFEMAAPAAAAPSSEDDFELSVPPQPVADNDTDDSGPPSLTDLCEPPSLADAAKAAMNESRATETSAAAPTELMAPPELPLTAKDTVEAIAIGKSDRKQREKKKARRAGPRFNVDPVRLKRLAAVVGVCCLAGVGYGAYLTFGPRHAAECAAVLNTYQQLYDEVGKIRQSHGADIAPDTQKKFSDAINAARQPLANAAPGTVEDRLYQAGPYLLDMLANAGAEPQSAADARYAVSEKNYRDLVISARGELGK
ncbi:MAG TPA: DUF4339 domain-containing protein [Pirellulales bacterium]